MAETPASVTRRRAHLTLTVHPQTLERLDQMASRFALPRGHIIDKLVMSLATSIEADTLTCISGEICRIGRKDVPRVL